MLVHVCVYVCVCVIVPPNADTTLAREYDLEITSQFVPLGVYTLEVDYTNIAVQVKGEIKGRDRYAMGGPASSARRQRRLKNTLPAITAVLFFWKMLRSADFTLTLYARVISTTGTLSKMLHLPLSGSGANARDRRTHGRAAARLGTPRLVAVLVRRVGRQRHEVQVRRLAATVDAPCSASLFRLPRGDLYRRRYHNALMPSIRFTLLHNALFQLNRLSVLHPFLQQRNLCFQFCVCKDRPTLKTLDN